MNYLELLKEFRLFSKQYENKLKLYYLSKNKQFPNIEFANINLNESWSQYIFVEVGVYARNDSYVILDKFSISAKELESL